ncbi:transporter substrate-binding domain-containing protein [Prosthecochloris sp.]|uniref:transporter substrate-binding domain-containing protein n=1 Tax=Prosthecochloris sp. TaxID=290513 RepID=UPI0025CD7570|nr:transporter substrate-binding domain-containing protein [Prosthecochloris sp.]
MCVMFEGDFSAEKSYPVFFWKTKCWAAVVRCLLVALALFFPCTLSAAEGETELIVGIKQAPPFSMKNKEGEWEGISVELWKKIAQDNGFSYKFRESELENLLDNVSTGEHDASVAAITVTGERENLVDFSQPFFLSGLAIAVRENSSNWGRVIKVFFSSGFLRIVLLLSLILLVSGFLVWFFERVKNPEQFGGSPAKGIGHGFWWAAVTMTTVGYGDKAPKTPGGRMVALVWMFASLIIISGFTAAITTALTVGSLDVPIKGVHDLHTIKTGTVSGSTSIQFLTEEYISFQEFGTIEEALQSLQGGRIDAVVYDEPIMRYMTASGGFEDIRVLEHSFKHEYYAIALPPGSPLAEKINRSLLDYTASKRWRLILFKYLNYAF